MIPSDFCSANALRAALIGGDGGDVDRRIGISTLLGGIEHGSGIGQGWQWA